MTFFFKRPPIALASLPLIALLAGCSGGENPPQEEVVPRVLYNFDSCDDLLSYAKEHAKESLDEYGTYWGVDEGGPLGVGEDAQNDGGEGTGGGDPEPGVDYSETNVQEAGVDEPDLVKTDGERIVALAQQKLHIVDASGATAQLRGSLPLAYGWGAEIFLYEDRVLVLERIDPWYFNGGGGDWGGEDPDTGEGGGEPPPQLPDLGPGFKDSWLPITRISEVDISDLDAPVVVRNLYVAGDYVSARRIDGVVRVVLRSYPTGIDYKDPYEFIDPNANPQTEAEWQALWEEAVAKAKVANAAAIDASDVDNWVPHYAFEEIVGGQSQISTGLLLGCTDAMHPGVYSGLSMTSVLTVDLEQGLTPQGGVGVFAEGAIVYASRENLYIATKPWLGSNAWNDGGFPDGGDVVEPDDIPEPIPGTGGSTGDPEPTSGGDPDATSGGEPMPAQGGVSHRASEEEQGVTSYIHKFAIPAGEKAIYVASGEVRGTMLSQWAMSEKDDDLRVATTDQTSWDTQTSESYVSVLREQEGELVQIGQVGGLGKGEQIQGVRFIGDVGYVVTFRQVDPLYTVDLSDPTDPKVAGELKILGYSAYLHPLDATHLIGVGYDGTEEGQLLGVQVSLFDVSDLANPIRTSQVALADGGYTEAAFDHHAFLYWDPADLAVFPVEWYSWDEEQGTEDYFAGAVGFTIDAEGGITPAGQITHIADPNDPWLYGNPGLRRSLVIGELLYTVSESGLKASTVSGLGDHAWLAW